MRPDPIRMATGHGKQGAAPKLQQQEGDGREESPEPTGHPPNPALMGRRALPSSRPEGVNGKRVWRHQIPSPTIPAPSPLCRERQEFLEEGRIAPAGSIILRMGRGVGSQGSPRLPRRPPRIQESQISQHGNCPRSRNERHPKQPARMKYLHGQQRLEAPARKPPVPPTAVPSAVTPEVGAVLGDPTSPGSGDGAVPATPRMLPEPGNGGCDPRHAWGAGWIYFGRALRLHRHRPGEPPAGSQGRPGPHRLSPTSPCQLNVPAAEGWCGGTN